MLVIQGGKLSIQLEQSQDVRSELVPIQLYKYFIIFLNVFLIKIYPNVILTKSESFYELRYLQSITHNATTRVSVLS